MKSIKIGSGAGYSDDRLEPALDIIRDGDVDYIVFECLAERTIAIAQQRKMKDSKQGYDSLLEYRMAQVLPLCVENNVKIVTNMGAANPKAAAEMVKQIAEKQGLHHLKIAAVTGDDVFPKIERYQNETLLENGKQIKELGSSIVSANAYIGAAGIVQALKAGADIVITGRAADPSLFLGPMMYEFGWSFENAELLGKGTIGGHLMECGAQITGGYFADPGYKEVPELWNVGFPIMEVTENGEYHITKLANAGGLVSLATVKEQLLYEIHDPANYLTPDVIADFSSVQVEEVAKDVVKVFGGSGKLKTGLLKTSIGYKDGYIAEAEISYGGAGSVERAKLAKTIMQKRLAAQDIEPIEIRYDFIGLNSLYANETFDMQEAPETRLRIAARTEEEAVANTIVREAMSLYTNGPAGGGGIRSNIKEIVSIGSILIPEPDTDINVSYWEV
ncbi:acyclic terpene utilization AtuA family protein [Psychrobacter alimentarius]|uniref:acyclic terpene utilization AtuA family protein n=1 Tax=Psychrobacter TaxID=497 RepID=UPI000BAB1616|nr:acyclic terpene utilization AtuA family protein [Psychrobacter sp. JB193]PAT63979.1 ABC transporter substrate-binding protein [Psychrobacter sp. JB193]